MANIVLGSIVADARGKCGTEIYSRNSAGAYVRSLPTWSQPDSQRQLDCRATMTALSQYWSGTLTEAQRATWRKYAHQHPLLNVWGHPIITTGFLAFIRHNAHYYRYYLGVIFTTAPTIPPIHQCAITLVADASSAVVRITYPLRNTWPQPGDMKAYIFAGLQKNAGVSYFSAPWRFVGLTAASGAAWQFNPDSFSYPSGPPVPPPQTWPVLATGKRVWAYAVVQSQSTGALSSPYYTQAIVIP